MEGVDTINITVTCDISVDVILISGGLTVDKTEEKDSVLDYDSPKSDEDSVVGRIRDSNANPRRSRGFA